jgi:thiol:disulfide interchange protein DsbD
LTTYAWFFFQGVLVDLTPCVYPLIPITVSVFGAKGVSRGRALALASAYVFGMAVFYTAIAVFAGLTGSAFGSWLGNPWVVLPIVALLLALAASMFGAFDLQLPPSLQTRLNSVGGAGPFGAFLMGLVSALIAAPCTGPVLLSLLAYVANASAAGESLLYGASLFFVYALGMGTLFFAVALGASLLRPGPWMEFIKSVFGIMLIVMAVWFLRPLSPAVEGFIVHPRWGLWLGIAIATVGLGGGAVHLSFYGPWSERLRKGTAVGVAVLGLVIGVNNVLYVPPLQWSHVTTFADLERSLQQAESQRKPVLVDFSAKWCLPCKELELQTFHHDSVEPLLGERFALIKIDLTDPTADQETMQQAFNSGTLPSVVVYGSDTALSGHLDAIKAGGPLPRPDAHFATFVEADAFLAKIEGIE